MTYKFLLFDLDHTLLDFDVAEDLALEALLAEQGFTAVQDFKNVYIPMNRQLWMDMEHGHLSKKELVDTRFSRAFAEFGLDLDGRQLAERYAHHLAQQGQAYPDAAELLQALKGAGYQLYAATNGITEIQQGRLAVSGFEDHFDGIFISDQLGAQKPERAFFDKATSQIPGFDAAKALMIGDKLAADIAGGLAAGLDTVWCNFRQQENTSPWTPTYVVRDYQELKALLL